MSDDINFDDGQLLLHSEGTTTPELTTALANSPELRERLDDLRALDTSFARLFAAPGRPDPQDLVDVACGLATAQQQLRVAAYTRESVQGRTELAALVAALAPPPKRSLPNWLALPALAAGVRGSTSLADQSFYSAEVAAQVALRVLPPADERWGVEGMLTRDGSPIANVLVTLRAGRGRPRRAKSDETGFFGFRGLPVGNYTLHVALDDGTVMVPNIVLTHG